MSIRCDSSSLIAGSIVCGVPGLGILGSVILDTTGTGAGGPGILFNDVQAGDEGKEFRGERLSGPASGVLTLNEDGTFTFTGPVNDSFTYRGWVDGVTYGTAVVSLYATVGAASGDLAPISLTAATASGGAAGFATGTPAQISLSAATATASAGQVGQATGTPASIGLSAATGSAVATSPIGNASGGFAPIALSAPQAPIAGGDRHGFVIVDLPSKSWWKRKPSAMPEAVAEKKVKRVAKVIEQVARKEDVTQRDVREAVAPYLAEMPGFDWKQLYRQIVLQNETRRRMEAADKRAKRAKQIEQDDEDILLLMLL